MGVDLVAIATSSVPSLSDACIKAMDAGIQVVVRGETSTEGWGFEPTALECEKNTLKGWYNTDMLFAYVKQNMPDVKTAKFALAEFTIPINCREITEGVRMRIAAETELSAEVAYFEDMVMTPEEGFTLAQEALTYDPDIRYFASYCDAPIIGANNYILQLEGADVSEFIGITNSGTDEVVELMSVFAEHGSIIPGYISTDYHDNAKALRDCSWNCLMGIDDTSSLYIEYSDIIIDTTFGYEYGDGGQMWPES